MIKGRANTQVRCRPLHRIFGATASSLKKQVGWVKKSDFFKNRISMRNCLNQNFQNFRIFRIFYFKCHPENYRNSILIQIVTKYNNSGAVIVLYLVQRIRE